MKLRMNIGKGNNDDQIKRRELGPLFTNLAQMLQNGLSLRHGLEMYGALYPKRQKFVGDTIWQLYTGISFADALKNQINVDTYYQLKIAEENGQLAETLNSLGEIYTTRNEQAKKLRQLLEYPLILLSLLVALAIGLKIAVFPQLEQWNPDSWQMPLWIKLLLILSLLGLGFLGWLKYRKVHRSSGIQRAEFVSKLPIFGKAYRCYYEYYLLSNLGMFLKSGINLKELCEIVKEFNNRSLLHDLAVVISASSVEGGDLETIINRYSFIPAQMTLFIHKGDALEDLGIELTQFSRVRFTNLIAELEHLLVWVQPLLFGIIALGIIGLYLSILMPMYKTIGGIY